MSSHPPHQHVAIACGGTGGHLFPGLAVGLELRARGIEVSLLISPKEVDQSAVAAVRDQFRLVVLPAMGFQVRRSAAYLRSFLRSWTEARRFFKAHPPGAVLGMGGFTSVTPILAGRRAGVATLLHESNTIPGRANRWLAPWVDECMAGFSEALPRLRQKRMSVTGTPVRPGFFGLQREEACRRVGLDSDSPVLLVMGGSQGAAGINRRRAVAYPEILRQLPDCQWVHLTGTRDFPTYETLAQSWPGRGRLLAFSSEMEVWMSAATAAVTRAGASSLAELSAVQLPSVLIPYPSATDDHQMSNGKAFASDGAALLLAESEATPERLAQLLVPLLREAPRRQALREALARRAAPAAAVRIADRVLAAVERRFPGSMVRRTTVGGESATSPNPRPHLREVCP